MARSFNIEIFRKVINTGVTYYSDAQFDELLGRADRVVIQAIVDATPGAATVTATFQSSNDGAPNTSVWTSLPNTAAPSPASASDVPKAAMATSTKSNVSGMRGRVAVTTSAQNGVAVRVIACGRTNSRG